MSNIVPNEADRDFTASAYVIKENKVLLMNHKKTGLWLQPGGHIEKNELPHETAKREALEETGFNIELEQTPKSNYQAPTEDLPKPFKVNAHRIEQGHWHCDFAFKATVTKKQKPTHSHEHNGLKWLTQQQIKSGSFEIPKNVEKTALSALET